VAQDEADIQRSFVVLWSLNSLLWSWKHCSLGA